MRIHVVAAVIRSAAGEVLIALRSPDQHQGGLWEFPGGKVEAGEQATQALARELHEELGIQVTASAPLIQIAHDYADKSVFLDVWEVTGFTGEPKGAEGQPLRWVRPKDLSLYEFPAANRGIVRAAQLPERYLITPEVTERLQVVEGVQKALADGIKLIQLRAPGMFDAQYRDTALDVVGLSAGKAQVMLKGPSEWLGDFPAAGWHLTAKQLREYAPNGRPFPRERMLAASCHCAEEIELAIQAEVDFITLSPVLPTQTHPDAQPLGWEQTQALVARCPMPVYLLGGMRPNLLEQARSVGAQGIAGIRNLWPVA